MKILKILNVELTFLLDDDFEGGIPEGLRALAKYYESHDDRPGGVTSEDAEKMTVQDYADKRFEIVTSRRKVRMTGRRFIGKFDNGQWVDFEKGPL
jgi:hypothetical protein